MEQIRAFINSKAVKDFVADFLMGIAAGTAGVVITSVEEAHAASVVLTFAVLKAGIQAGYRALYRWATT